MDDGHPSQDIGRHSGEMRARAWANHLDGSCNPCVFWASARGCAKEKCDFCHLVHEPKAEDLGRPRREKREAIKRAIFADFAVEDEDERHRLLQDAAAKHPFARNFIKGLLDNPAFHVRIADQDLVFSL
ncbi:Reticulocyte-binding protein 2-like a [Durusdinium trenchii]|uniref:Reticulocyte-binding protein 2-like a n=1 Tax=Durusdinium trenchii TaxID=1381693 RepID=A0ABP0R7F6_9DINO